jgi:drug/metabolite transporter (DMT)-like permease
MSVGTKRGFSYSTLRKGRIIAPETPGPEEAAITNAPLAVAALLVTAVFAGLNGVSMKLLYRDSHFDAFGLLAARGVWTVPLMATLAWIARPAQMPGAADWWRILLLSLCYGPLACGFVALGAQYTSGAHVAILLSAAPPVTAVIGAALLGERVDRLRIFALAIGLAGAVLLATTRSSTGSGLLGDLLLVVTLCGVAMMFVLVRRLAPHVMLRERVGPTGFLSAALIAVSIGLAVIPTRRVRA